MSARPSPLVSNAGQGRQGYCRLCSLKDPQAQLDLDQRLRDGWNATQVKNWLESRHEITATRQTIYSHRDHVKHPKDRLVTAVQRTQARAVTTKPVATNEQFLEAIRDIGYQRAIDNPEEVTVDHSIKAASILANSKRSSAEITLVLARVSVGADYSNVIEGEAVEVLTQ